MLVAPQEEWQVVSVMLLSEETDFLSDVDLLIPREVSGVGQDLLAETWHVLPMLACNLLQPVGQRLSREIYDVLLSVGDYHYGLVDQAPSTQEIQVLGLISADVSIRQQPEIQGFHQQEEAWSDVLSVPLAAYRTYLKAMKLTDAVLEEALQLEQELKPQTSLRNWPQKIFEVQFPNWNMPSKHDSAGFKAGDSQLLNRLRANDASG